MVFISVSSHLLIVLSHDDTNLGSSLLTTMGLVVILSLAGILPRWVALVSDSLWFLALSRVSISSEYVSMKEVTSVVILASFRWLPSGLSVVPVVLDCLGGPMYCVSRLSSSNSLSGSEWLSSVASRLIVAVSVATSWLEGITSSVSDTRMGELTQSSCVGCRSVVAFWWNISTSLTLSPIGGRGWRGGRGVAAALAMNAAEVVASSLILILFGRVFVVLVILVLVSGYFYSISGLL